MSLDLEHLPIEDRYRIFEALSHPTRVRILELVEGKTLAFSGLKRELGLESNGQLQHHLQKLSGFVAIEGDGGNYGLTDAGRRALDTYRLGEASGTSLEAICCLPARLQDVRTARVGLSGSVLRISFAFLLLALTAALVLWGQVGVRYYGASVSVGGFGLVAAVGAGFFGVSFLIAGLTRAPGCEVTAIPNLFAGKRKYYSSCVITAFNLPNGRLLESIWPNTG